jgi:hypothetical protein
MTADVPAAVRVLSRLLPAADRESILGDLLEDAAYRDLDGARRQLWLATECAAIAAGLSATRTRGWLVMPTVRELAAGMAVDGNHAFRGAHPGAVLLRAVIFCGSVATLALGVELLVGSLLVAAGF